MTDAEYIRRLIAEAHERNRCPKCGVHFDTVEHFVFMNKALEQDGFAVFWCEPCASKFCEVVRVEGYDGIDL